MKKTIQAVLSVIGVICLTSCSNSSQEKPEIMCEFTLRGDTLYHTHRNLSDGTITDGPDTCIFYQEALKIFSKEEIICAVENE